MCTKSRFQGNLCANIRVRLSPPVQLHVQPRAAIAQPLLGAELFGTAHTMRLISDFYIVQHKFKFVWDMTYGALENK